MKKRILALLLLLLCYLLVGSIAPYTNQPSPLCPDPGQFSGFGLLRDEHRQRPCRHH